MNDGKLTPRAAVLWGTIPKEGQGRILKNVFFVRCRGAVEITNFTGEEENGEVIRRGVCAKCGHEVARVVETSEQDSSGNQRERIHELA
jgi:hypothetical protein